MSRKLLLADDSITIQRVIELTFSGEDVSVIAVGDGEQAIARIPIEKPDIVLADIGMPKRSGYEVSAFVKEHPELSHIPVLLLAGAFEPVDEARARQVKCDGVLVKPFEPQSVIARVRELVDPSGSASAGSSMSSRASDRVRQDERQADAARGIPAPSSAARVPPKTERPEPAAPLPDLAELSGPGDKALDEYFDRLDAAFATLGNTTPSAAPVPEREDVFGSAGIPTIEDLLASAPLDSAGAGPSVAPPPLEPPDVSPTLTAAPAPGAAPSFGSDSNVIAEMFKLLFAVEQGERDITTVRIGPQPAPPAPVVISDEVIDQITRRVLERLAPDTARNMIADVVSETAERLVRDEIARIRKLQSE